MHKQRQQQQLMHTYVHAYIDALKLLINVQADVILHWLNDNQRLLQHHSGALTSFSMFECMCRCMCVCACMCTRNSCAYLNWHMPIAVVIHTHTHAPIHVLLRVSASACQQLINATACIDTLMDNNAVVIVIVVVVRHAILCSNVAAVNGCLIFSCEMQIVNLNCKYAQFSFDSSVCYK